MNAPIRLPRGLSEADWTAWVIDLAQRCGWRVSHQRPARTSRGWRTAVQGHIGAPDLLLARDGDVLAVELKADRGRIRPDQAVWLAHLGAHGHVWRPRDAQTVAQRLARKHDSDRPAATHSDPHPLAGIPGTPNTAQGNSGPKRLRALRCGEPHPLDPVVLCEVVGCTGHHTDTDGNHWTQEDLVSDCRICTRRTAATGHACWRCHDHLADLLDPANIGSPFDLDRPDDARRLPSIPALAAMLDATPCRGGDPGPLQGGFASKPPCSLTVVALQDPRSHHEHEPRAPLTVLGLLAERVDRRSIDGQRSTPPAPATVAGLAGWLHGHLDWLIHQPWIDSAARDIRRLHAELRAATGDPPPRAVGTCRATVDDDGAEDPAGHWRCAWPLYVPELPPRAPDEPVQIPTLRCSSCGHRYSGAELIALGRQEAS